MGVVNVPSRFRENMAFYQKSISTPSSTSFDDSISNDTLSERRHRFVNSGRSISMATVQAQVSLAQSLRSLFQAARDPKERVDTHIEDAWLQAVYNAVVFSMVGVVLCILIAVYYILEPFLHPLLWAVLTGAFLFPFKYSSTAKIEQWLEYMSDSGIPLAAGLLLSPLSSVNFIYNKAEVTVLTYWKLISVLTIITVTVYVGVQFNIGDLVYNICSVTLSGFQYMDSVLDYTKYLQIILILTGLSFIILYSGKISQPYWYVKLLIVSMWYLVLVNLATIMIGALAVPVITVLFVMAIFGYLIQSNKSPIKANEPEELFRQMSYRRKSVFSDAYDMIQSSIVQPGLGILEQSSSNNLEPEKQKSVESVLVDLPPSDDEKENEEENVRPRRSVVRFKTQSLDSSEHEYQRTKKLEWSSTQCPSFDDNIDTQYDYYEFQSTEYDSASSKAFLILITLCSLLVLLRHPYLLLLVLPFCLIWCIKQLVNLSVTLRCYKFLMLFVSKLYSWCLTHQNKLIPQPIPVLLQICGDIDNLAFVLLKQFVGSLMSAIIIISLLLCSIGLAVFVIFQIQLEISYTVGLVTQVLNSTVAHNPWIYDVLGYRDSNSTFHAQLHQFANQGFHYGREWLANQIQILVDDTSVKEQLLNLYDKMYHAYVFGNSTSNVQHTDSHDIAIEGLQMHMWHQVKHVLFDNLETVFSILMSLWSILSVNISILITIFTSLSSIIFSGGTFLFNFIIYITTLFYLLAYSNDQYLPIKCVLSVLPNIVTESTEKNYADTFTRVIQSVFYASIRRACFYGLYTWFILSIFGMEIIILPSALAALAGAVPFVGSYWVGLPAILQLWLIEDSLFLALVALGLFLLPPFMVDSLINSEIEGSHPYLTGLAIAGGIYFAGLEGALLGPILLCCLLFIVNRLTENL